MVLVEEVLQTLKSLGSEQAAKPTGGMELKGRFMALAMLI